MEKLITIQDKIFTAVEIATVEATKLNAPNKDTELWFPIPREGEVNHNARIDVSKIQMTDKYLGSLYKYLDKALVDFTGFSQPKCDGFVVALSGGLDSAVITKIFADYTEDRGIKLKTIIMGQGDSNVQVDQYKGTPAEWIDIQYAKLMCKDLGLDYDYLDISRDLEALTQGYQTSWAKGGLRPRIRANHLYTMAEEHDLIAVGSTNGSEYILVAFSTGGPAGNIAPLADLYKTEVYAVARDIGVPDYIQTRKPLISELNLADYSLYGGGTVDSTLIDPIIRRLWFQKQKPAQVARELGHSKRWITDIDEKRIKGETCRRNYEGFIINRTVKFKDIKPNLTIDRSYFP